MTVDWTTILALLVTLSLVGYLTLALLFPERFS
ncbi:MAG: K(+)-transporting ATPase subunit F [Planctomycetota bacterium]|nr:MAG: K(+)-transporting ATPase subunit F [Planctomycetota bacterium]